jgi:hypothetical protein
LVSNCFFSGVVHDAKAMLGGDNVLKAPGPELDAKYAARSSRYKGVGYRPR